MLRQLREGLQLYGLIGVMERNRAVCRDLFVAGDDEKVSYYDLLNKRHVGVPVVLSIAGLIEIILYFRSIK